MDRTKPARTPAARVAAANLFLGVPVDRAEELRSALGTITELGEPAALAGFESQPAVVVIGAEVPSPLSALQARPPGMQAVVLASTPDIVALRKAVQVTPLASGDVEIVPADGPIDALIGMVRAAGERALKQQEYRRTIIDLDAQVAAKTIPGPSIPAYLGDLVDHLPVGVATLAPDGRVTGLNPRAATILGISERHAVGWPLADLFPDREAINAMVQTVLSGPPGEAVAVSTDRSVPGLERIVTLSVRTGSLHRDERMILAVIEDVTSLAVASRARAEAERSLRDSEGRLQLALRAGAFGTVELDLATGLIRTSGTARLLHAFPPAGFVSTLRTLREHIAPADVPEFNDLFDPVGSTRRGAYRVRDREGTLRWIQMSTAVMRDDRGDTTSVIGVCNDITAERDYTETVETARAEAEHLAADLARIDRLRTTFLSTLSHDVRRPLTSLIGFAQTLIQHGDKLNGDVRDEAHRSILLNAERILHLVEQLIDASIVHEAGDVTPVDLLEVETRIVDTISPADHKVVLAGAPVAVRLDSTVLERIITNLVRNAVDHTPVGTTITVHHEVSDDGPVVLTVEDDGPGLTVSDLGRIFDPFWHRDDSKGMGMGLWLVARLAELHEGGAEVETRPEGGVRFRISLEPLRARPRPR